MLKGKLGPHVGPGDFAPDILRIQATPPRPLPRAVLGIFLTLFVAGLTWAALGRLDVVAVAQGKLVPRTSIKIVQPMEAGIVREILVAEGQDVRAGDVLLRMDATLNTAELDGLRSEFAQKDLALRRIDAELGVAPLSRRPNEPLPFFQQAQAQLQANVAALKTAIAQENATLQRSREEMAAAQAQRTKLEQTLPHYRAQDAAYRDLVKEGFAGRLMGDDKTRERVEKEHESQAQAHAVERERANMALSQRRIEQLRSEYERRLRDERAEVAQRLEGLRTELTKQTHRQALLELRAPQDGKVKDLATRTVGAVVQPGTILLTLVPAAEALDAEVWLSNEDVGFVVPGQPVRLKLSAFQFQKYGMLDGRVEQIAADASPPEGSQGPAAGAAQTLVYRTVVKPNSQVLRSDGAAYPLSAGMQATAEIKLGERTVMEYLLSPVRKAWHEAARER